MSVIGDNWCQLLGIAVSGACIFSASCVTAQIMPDRTLPNNSIVTVNGNVSNITGGTQAGRNLFHSFQQFSVPTGGRAFFNNGIDVQNIISRITGGSASNIDGIIQANGTANVFILNPSGIVFGRNASLNIGGSFVATTANAIQFGNLGFFSASNPDAPSPLLTINPSALLFNQQSNSGITNRSQADAGISPEGDRTNGLRVPDGNSILLVGGSINLDGGRLRAYGGHVDLAGLAAPGSVGLNVAGTTLSLNVPDNVQRADVSLSNNSAVSVVGAGGGDVTINAHNLDINGSSQVQAGMGSGLGTQNSQAGDIKINATGAVTLNQTSSISNTVAQQAQGNAGNINIQASDISIINQTSNPALDTETNGQGHAGNVSLSATGSIVLTGQSVSNNDQVISTFNNSKGLGSGDISILANGLISLDNTFIKAASIGQGTAGSISLQGNKGVSLKNNSSLVSATFFNGNAGNITIKSFGPISLQNSLVSSGVGFPDDKDSKTSLGNAGNISIIGKSISVIDGAEVSSRTFSGGRSGNILLQATDTITISGKASILPRRKDVDRATSYDTSTVAATSETNARGIAGDISIDTNNLLISDNGAIRSESRSKASTGSININANTVELVRDSNITTNAINNTVAGGNVNLSTQVLTAVDNSRISANSDNFQGGQIRINTQGLFVSPNSSITATGANPQLNGTVQIITPDIDPTRSLVNLPIITEQSSKLVSSSCEAFNEASGGSSFTITGRGGLPPGPEEFLTNDALWTDTRLSVTTAQHQHKTHTTKSNSQPITIVPATSWVSNNKGEVTLISSVSNAASSHTPTSCPVK